MKTIKITLLLLSIFILPHVSFAQKGASYILPTGEHTIIVNAVERDFETDKDRFLLRDPRYRDVKTYLTKGSRLTSLEEAIYRTDELLKKIEEGEAETLEPNEALSLPMSIRLVKYNSTLNQARVIADSLMYIESEMTERQLVKRMIEFGNTPSYFVNGKQVTANEVSKLQPNDILSKQIKAVGSLSGNPNGEIWFDVNDRSSKQMKSYNKQISNNKGANDSDKIDYKKPPVASSRKDYYNTPTIVPEGEHNDAPKRFRNQSQPKKNRN